MSKMLEKARIYEKEESGKVKERPVFHFSNPVGWMNDPNGFSDYKGEHHLFFQYYPYETRWQSMHWGHAKSNDFIKWEYLPAALAPDTPADSEGVFSGSALTVGEKQILCYTGVEEKEVDNRKVLFQNQCIAIGDGVNYEKFANNPVLRAEALPPGSSLEDFRDPKIWEEDGKYYMVVGSRAGNGSGQIALFCTENFNNWEYIGILDSSKNEIGKMWECPDFFPLDSKQILLISPQEMEGNGLEFYPGNNVVFLVGSYDKDNKCFTRESYHNADYGLNFYAPQTMHSDDGRRIMIGWMQSWDNPIYLEDYPWSGLMSVPRELTFKKGRVYQKPVVELETYYQNPISYKGLCIQNEQTFNEISGKSIDLELVITGNEYKSFNIRLAANKNQYSEIFYNREAQTLTFDRTHSGIQKDKLNTRTMAVKSEDDVLKLRILLDRYSVEIFVNDGEQVMTSLIYAPQTFSDIIFTSDGKTYLDILKHDIVVN